MNKTRFSVAANFDDGLLDRIAPYPVEDVYGKLTNDFVGGGRASYSAQGIGAKVLKSHVDHAHLKGIKFTYLLNSACLGNKEWTKHGMARIHKLLDWLSEIKVDSLTIAIPYLAEVVKKQYPHFFLKVGIFAHIDSPDRARFWQDAGADMLTLESFSINRNVTLLRQIRKAVSCRLQLITNFTCLSRCPMQPYHMAGLSHGSMAGDKNPFVDYCALKCSYHTLKDPRLIIKSQWIRPEDVGRYENIGYYDFKLLERNAPTDLMAQRVKAYAERSSPPNLLDLIQPYGFQEQTTKEFGWQFKYFFSFLKNNAGSRDIIDLLKKRGLLYSLKNAPIFLNSAEIPNDFWEKISAAECSLSGNCSRCGYCTAIAESAYTVDSAYKEECLALYERVFDRLCSR